MEEQEAASRKRDKGMLKVVRRGGRILRGDNGHGKGIE
jgi:hypothetical protein